MIHQTSLAQHSFHVASKTEAISVKTLDSTMFTWSGKRKFTMMEAETHALFETGMQSIKTRYMDRTLSGPKL